MNNSKIWLVVKPTVGVPIFLSAVAIGSFAVHVAVLTNTGWVSDFLSGNELGSTQAAAMAQTAVKPAALAGTEQAPVTLDAAAVDALDAPGGLEVTLPDGRKARLVVDDPLALASAEIPERAPVSDRQ